MQNNQMSILKGLGIILVVMGHIYTKPFFWFYPESFHMALFIFISGYFYNEKYESNRLFFIYKRGKKLLGLYFSYNIFYLFVTYAFFKKYKIMLGDPIFHFKTFFITPFLDGHQYLLFLAAWFVITIYLVQIIFMYLFIGFKYITKNKYVHLFLFLCLGVLSTYLASKGYNTGVLLPIVKILFSLPFFYAGYFFKKYVEKFNIYRSETILVILTIQMLTIWYYFNNPNVLGYALAWGNFNGHIFSPIFISLNSIFLFLFISKALSAILKPNDLLIKLGENSFHIMSNHLLVFLIINYYFIKVYNLPFSELNISYSYNVDKYWFIYVALGVLGPTYAAISFRKLKSYIYSLIFIKRKEIVKAHLD